MFAGDFDMDTSATAIPTVVYVHGYRIVVPDYFDEWANYSDEQQLAPPRKNWRWFHQFVRNAYALATGIKFSCSNISTIPNSSLIPKVPTAFDTRRNKRKRWLARLYA